MFLTHYFAEYENAMKTISQKTAFSKSAIWNLQRDYFQEAGIDAWRQGVVPHYITSNTVIGETYAELIFALLKDLAWSGDVTQRVHILELGAGHGRLCFHILKHLDRLTALYPHPLPPFRYILSDFTQQNLDFWKTHPRFQSYFEAGVLDYALFDACNTCTLELQYTGDIIEPDQLNQPLTVLANYFFDTIPQELFRVKDSQIELATLEVQEQVANESGHAALRLENMQFKYDTQPIEFPIYRSPLLNDLLDAYRCDLADTWLLFPHMGLECLQRLRSLSRSGLILITADKGQHEWETLDHSAPPEIATHGSFSLSVNYHAFKAFTEMQGGRTRFPQQMTHSLVVGCMILTDNPRQFGELEQAYERNVGDFGPDDYFSLKKLIESNMNAMSMRDITATIRLSSYDARFFTQMLPRINQLLGDLDDSMRWTLFQTVHRVWEKYFPLQEENDLAAKIGNLLLELDFPKEALTYYERSIQIYGSDDDVLFQCAVCHHCLNNTSDATTILTDLIQRDPCDKEARELLLSIKTGA